MNRLCQTLNQEQMNEYNKNVVSDGFLKSCHNAGCLFKDKSEIKSGYFMKTTINISTVMNSGQVFSIDKVNENAYRVLSADKCLIIKEDDSLFDKGYYYEGDKEYWDNYFNSTSRYSVQQAARSNNKFLYKCAKYSKGMVILKQDLWETLISFIVSQRKNIPAIKSSLNRIREKFGRIKTDPMGNPYHTFPTAEELKDVTLDDLQDLGLGYRDEYILDAIHWWNTYYDTHKNAFELNDGELHMKLLKEIKGVGDKVANCVCLFALNDLDAFPVDVWIQRALDKGLFAMEEIEEYQDKGVIQQIIFYYVINHKEEFVK